MVIYLKPMSHQIGVLTAFPQRLKILQTAEVRAVQTPATLDGRTDRPSDGRDKANPLYPRTHTHDKKVCRRYEVDTKCYGRKDGRAL